MADFTVSSDIDAFMRSIDKAAARANLGLTAGTATGNVLALVDVGGSPGLPAIDGSQLTGLQTVFTPTLSDYSDSTYVYHGGELSDGGYRVKRYLKSDPTTNAVADDQLADLATAWTNRATLTYS
jgi:hypothetical protein